MESNVFFVDFRATFQENLGDKLHRLMTTAGLLETVGPNDLTAVKLHFGESGNTAFIRPVFIRRVTEAISSIGATPFLTDTNTLYRGTRSNTPAHLSTAIHNGFAYAVVNAPVVIADGLRGSNYETVSINEQHFTNVPIASDIYHADSMVCVSHFKGHELSGFGGALKNLGMGCSARKGKLMMHSTVAPKITRKKCTGCGDCTVHCPTDAITITDDKAHIDEDKCIGCGDCIIVCTHSAAQVRWNQTIPDFLEKMIEFSKGATMGKKGKILYVSFISDVSPMCDCVGHNDTPIVGDVGMAASTDPVALDMACVDLVNKQPGHPHSCLKSGLNPGEDKFAALYPKIDWRQQLEYAEKIGLGSTSYNLVKLDTTGLKK